MTTRRQFIRGAVSAAVAASLPASGDGVELYSATHPPAPAPAFLPFVTDNDTGMFRHGSDHLSLVTGKRYAEMLAHSMMQTKEQVGANVYTRKVFELESLEEIEIDIPE